jgi:hypothetical protein
MPGSPLLSRLSNAALHRKEIDGGQKENDEQGKYANVLHAERLRRIEL